MTAQRPEPAAHSALRVSHADRERVVDQLREAAAEGRLEMDELDTRLGQALTAKTFGDLAPLTADLPPVDSPEGTVGPPERKEPLILKGGMHGASRTGRWQVPGRIAAYGNIGGVTLDFTLTETRLPEVEVEVHGQMAGVTIVIPGDWAASTDDVEPEIGGVQDKTTPDRLPGTPLIRLTGNAGMGGVIVRHPNFRERRRLKRGR
ncbi:DUF1707 SHOCT-like domain-containing protein [Streptomyces sp. NPDC054796]